MKKILLLFVVLLLVVGCTNTNKLYKKITKAEVEALLSENEVLIVDVRSSNEYAISHIENAINIPIDTVHQLYWKDVISDYDSYVVVYCQSGYRSKQAADFLNSEGYINVYDLGSINNWGIVEENEHDHNH